jgi:hypothetical protein
MACCWSVGWPISIDLWITRLRGVRRDKFLATIVNRALATGTTFLRVFEHYASEATGGL